MTKVILFASFPSFKTENSMPKSVNMARHPSRIQPINPLLTS